MESGAQIRYVNCNAMHLINNLKSVQAELVRQQIRVSQKIMCPKNICPKIIGSLKFGVQEDFWSKKLLVK